MSLHEIQAALEAELAATPAFYDFRVQHREADGGLWRVRLEPGTVFADGQRPGLASSQALLDDSLDGASAWWGADPSPGSGGAGGSSSGGASVLAVHPESDELVLHQASSTPPGPGRLIRLYPPRFLPSLLEAWNDPPWATAALALAPCLNGAPEPRPGPALTGEPFRWLRAAQRSALGLADWRCSFLWGPPGTGKTTTLGVLLAEYLDTRPQARVLLMSTTNHAVDLATLAVDKALQKGRREALRPAVQRLGTRIDAAAYAGREHLLPTDDTGLVARLARAEAARPPRGDAAALKAWSDRVAALRDELRASSLQVLRRSRLAAMTTTRATLTLKTLQSLDPADRSPFDLMVFDEASQVSLAQALALMPLARGWLFAGDPQQLGPVQRSPDRLARRWLGRTAFSSLPRGKAPHVVLLDEQSRMAEPIGALVSDCFYGGALRLAADASTSADWRAARARPLAGLPANQHVHVLPMREDGAWSAADRGPVRRASVSRVVDLVTEALTDGAWQPHELVVLTPFRAQRSLLRAGLDRAGVPDTVRVSTVHRAQGSEAPVVLFDPVDGAQPFLQTEEAGHLINVAFSRAMAHLVVLLSPADATNPWLAAVLNRMRLAGDSRTAVPLQALAAAPGFPANAVGQRVQAGRHVGEVRRLSVDGATLWLVHERSGAELPIDVAFWRARAHAVD